MNIRQHKGLIIAVLLLLTAGGAVHSADSLPNVSFSQQALVLREKFRTERDKVRDLFGFPMFSLVGITDLDVGKNDKAIVESVDIRSEVLSPSYLARREKALTIGLRAGAEWPEKWWTIEIFPKHLETCPRGYGLVDLSTIGRDAVFMRKECLLDGQWIVMQGVASDSAVEVWMVLQRQLWHWMGGKDGTNVDTHRLTPPPTSDGR